MIDSIYVSLQSIRWQDALDILLNSYILFRLYVLFRGTHILRVLVGILFLLYFQKVAATMGLILTSWVIQGVTAAAALIIIVVFKNEIRFVLQTRNFKTFFFGIPPKPLSSSIGMITRSVFDLAERRCGALIVFPGKEDLQDVMHSGIQLNGRISEEMIKSIFWRDNPVHDGACIISADRIREVGVILPLSRRRDLPSHLGTRHRAAIGIS
ncbi:MAG TPA: diadenylate cyclase, partial [Tichowtungia sp.]|nr:diadenylate cyclase [Tichowtungia sp.]